MAMCIGGMNAKAIGQRGYRVATIAGVACPFVFLLANAALHLLRRDLDPATEYISEYAAGPFGPVMSGALVLLGLGTVALALGMFASLGRNRPARIGTGAIALSGASTILTGLCRTNLDGQEPTVAGAIHGGAACAAILFASVAVVALLGAFQREAHWRPLRGASVAFCAALASSAALVPLVPRGVGERLAIYTFVVWLLVLALRARSYHAGVPPVTEQARRPIPARL